MIQKFTLVFYPCDPAEMFDILNTFNTSSMRINMLIAVSLSTISSISATENVISLVRDRQLG